jgi:RNA polymerase sigma-70 factor (ECF subfamily)
MNKFEQVYENYFNRIYKFVFRLTGQAEDAKDITQEIFIKLNNHFSSYLNHANPKAWIYKVAANTCLNHLKRKDKYRKILDEVGRETLPVASTEEEYVKKEKVKQLRKGLEKLQLRDRIVLGLYRDGLSYSDMAQIIKVKKTSLGTILARAIEKLARQIKEEN